MGIVSFKSVIPPGAASPPQLICISDIHLSTDKYKRHSRAIFHHHHSGENLISDFKLQHRLSSGALNWSPFESNIFDYLVIILISLFCAATVVFL